MFNIHHPSNQKGVAVTFMGQAGFIFRFSDGTEVGVDLYLSDCCYRYVGFKRLMPYLCSPRELSLDLLICTHAHYDHFDPDSVPILLSERKTKMLAAYDVKEEAERLNLEEKKITYIKVGDVVDICGIQVEAIPCDHGSETPHAVGLLIKGDDRRIVIAGDTSFHEEYFSSEKLKGADLFIFPINGAYGNLNEAEGARAVGLLEPKLAVPCHYWNFAEHGGNPALFEDELKKQGITSPHELMRPGETITI